jgi:hypothetical protein
MKQVAVLRSYMTHVMEFDGHYFKAFQSADEGWWVDEVNGAGEVLDEFNTQHCQTFEGVKAYVAAKVVVGNLMEGAK